MNKFLANLFKIKTGFLGKLISNMAKMGLGAVADTANDKHCPSWQTLCGVCTELFYQNFTLKYAKINKNIFLMIFRRTITSSTPRSLPLLTKNFCITTTSLSTALKSPEIPHFHTHTRRYFQHKISKIVSILQRFLSFFIRILCRLLKSCLWVRLKDSSTKNSSRPFCSCVIKRCVVGTNIYLFGN